jgi:hypothetical protein
VGRAVSDTRGDADHRAAGKAADEACQRAVHSCDHDDAVGSLEVREHPGKPMDAGDPDVLVDDDRRAEQRGTDLDLTHDGPVGRAAGDDDDEPARLRHATRHPDAARMRILLRVGRYLADGPARRLVGARRKDAAGPALEQRGEDPRDLLRRLPFRENGLGSTLSELAMEVDASESQVTNRQFGEPLERVVRARRSRPNGLEELAEIVAEPGHRAIVR